MAETIHALATARGRAGVAIIRISGPAAVQVLLRLTGGQGEPRHARLADICNSDGHLLDRGLTLFFPEGRSFTGEDVVELHLHGGLAIIDAVIAAIEALGLSRHAKAGEFTQRAFQNGQMDLTEVQGLGDALDAETEQQRVAAMRRLSGETGSRFAEWRADLLHIIARLEATIDFADEEIPDDVTDGLLERLDKVIKGLADQLAAFDGAKKLRTGFEVALIGPPNAGKSSLINALTKRDIAIVSDTPGTTRDIVEARMDLNGMVVTFLDTAGLRDSDDQIEQIGVARARERSRQADLRIWLSSTGERNDDAEINLRTKIDEGGGLGASDLGISIKTGDGLDILLDEVSKCLANKLGSNGDISREYERVAFLAAEASLSGAREGFGDQPVEITLAALYEGIRGLDIVLGRIDVEDMLGEVFSSFCIGK